MVWHPGSSRSGGNDIVIYAAHAIVVAMETANGNQHFFVGHTDNVTAIAVNNHTGESVVDNCWSLVDIRLLTIVDCR